MNNGTKSKVIEMPAFGKARPRVTMNGTFMPREYEAKKKRVRLEFGPVPDGLVHLSVTAVRAMPKSWSKAKRAEMVGTFAQPAPDTDNILGGIMDALFGQDDRVVSVFCQKFWGEQHELWILVKPATGRWLSSW